MMLPAREFPEEDDVRTGSEGGTGTPARPPSLTDADEAALAGEATLANAGPSVEAVAGDRWSGILALFVDDPRGSVAEASVMVDEAVEALIASAREQQASLAASWQAADADTEQLRVALRQYRTFWSTVAQLPQPA
jgi:hypothetical protein